MNFENIAEQVYQETFDKMFDALVEEYKRGEIDLETLEANAEEQSQVLLNGMFEGETKFAYTNAIVDAHQFVISRIKNGTLVVE
ncbi:hypothetical protein I6E17_01785 [Fusobacterium perfoetens]|uniref:hypothetical protein n=1 Tax=Fusobacterium perfoetens TaxID=852 RepID=UPI0015A4C2AA|nr:hypothetical protein [Fusobacterium perfoetens]MCF2624907.1 hypothetical protein [Fusobacterium perfoetens]